MDGILFRTRLTARVAMLALWVGWKGCLREDWGSRLLSLDE